MPQPKRGLGKGLGALIPTAPGLRGCRDPGLAPGAEPRTGTSQIRRAVAGAYFEEVPVERDHPQPAAAAPGLR